MSELSKIGIVLTFLFSFFSLALFAEILYLLFFHRRTASSDQYLTGKPGGLLPSFLRRKKQHSGRVEPSGAPAPAHPAASEPPYGVADLEVAELIKLHNSRLLFTIKEEEREGADWSSERSGSLGDNRRRRLIAGDSPEKCTSAAEVAPESVCSDRTTPFATPCSSPTYYTPSPSPERETDCAVSGGGANRWSPEV